MRLIVPFVALSAITTSIAIAVSPEEMEFPLNSHYNEQTKTLSILGESILVKTFEALPAGYTYTVESDNVSTVSVVTQKQNLVRKTISEKREGGDILGISDTTIELELFEGSNPATTDELIMMTDNAKFEYKASLDLSNNLMVVADIEAMGCDADPKGTIKVNGQADFTESAKNVNDAWSTLKSSEIAVAFTQDGVSNFNIGLSADKEIVNLSINYAPVCKTINPEYMKGKDQGATAMFLGMGGGMLARSAPTLSQGLFQMMPLASAIIGKPNENASYSFSIPKAVLKNEIDGIFRDLSSSLKETVGGEVNSANMPLPEVDTEVAAAIEVDE